MAKVKIQGHASGTGILTVTAPNTSTDRTITLPDATGTLIADDGSSNVGIGVTPASDWKSIVTGLQIGNSGSIFARNDSGETKTFISENVKWTADAQEYINNGYASMHQMDSGMHTFQVAASGSADATITWNTAMTIANDGIVLVGKTAADGVAGGSVGVEFFCKRCERRHWHFFTPEEYSTYKNILGEVA